MRTLDIARRAARGLRSAKARTILTSLAIAVGAFTITVSLAAGEGARQYADKLISSNVNPRALFIAKDSGLFEGGQIGGGLRNYDPDISTTTSGVAVKQLTQDDVDKLSANEDLEYVIPTYMPRVNYVRFGDSQIRFTSDVIAYDPTITSEIELGKLPDAGEQLADDQAIMPESFAGSLVEQSIVSNRDELVGMTVTMTAAKPTVSPSAAELSEAFARGGQAAVIALTAPETREFSFTISALSRRSATALTGSTSIQISSNMARAISEYATEGTDSYQKYVAVTALVKEAVKPADMKAQLEADGFTAQTAEDLQGVIFTIVNTLQGIVFGFGVVALIASVFGIINTQYISVLERIREIGLMKALGMRGRHVSRLFQFEAAWIGFLGGIIGAVTAVVAGTLLNPWITETLKLGEGNYILIFQAVPIVLMVLALMAIAMIAGWFPARKAARLDPIEALRTE